MGYKQAGKTIFRKQKLVYQKKKQCGGRFKPEIKTGMAQGQHQDRKNTGTAPEKISEKLPQDLLTLSHEIGGEQNLKQKRVKDK
jgi:hypothetical protein